MGVTTLFLALTTSFYLDLTVGAPNGSAQGQFEEVLVQAQEPPGEVVLEETIGLEGGSLIETLYQDQSDRFFPSGDAVIIVREDALKSQTTVRLTVSPDNTTAYPDAIFLQTLYPIDEVEYIGPLATLEVPSVALNLDSEEDRLLFTITPSFYKGALDRSQQRDIRLEVRIHLEDGAMVFHTMRFGYAGEAPIWSDFLKANFGNNLPEIFGNNLPEIMKISVQAVDVSRALPNDR